MRERGRCAPCTLHTDAQREYLCNAIARGHIWPLEAGEQPRPLDRCIDGARKRQRRPPSTAAGASSSASPPSTTARLLLHGRLWAEVHRTLRVREEAVQGAPLDVRGNEVFLLFYVIRDIFFPASARLTPVDAVTLDPSGGRDSGGWDSKLPIWQDVLCAVAKMGRQTHDGKEFRVLTVPVFWDLLRRRVRRDRDVVVYLGHVLTPAHPPPPYSREVELLVHVMALSLAAFACGTAQHQVVALDAQAMAMAAASLGYRPRFWPSLNTVDWCHSGHWAVQRVLGDARPTARDSLQDYMDAVAQAPLGRAHEHWLAPALAIVRSAPGRRRRLVVVCHRFPHPDLLRPASRRARGQKKKTLAVRQHAAALFRRESNRGLVGLLVLVDLVADEDDDGEEDDEAAPVDRQYYLACTPAPRGNRWDVWDGRTGARLHAGLRGGSVLPRLSSGRTRYLKVHMVLRLLATTEDDETAHEEDEHDADDGQEGSEEEEEEEEEGSDSSSSEEDDDEADGDAHVVSPLMADDLWRSLAVPSSFPLSPGTTDDHARRTVPGSVVLERLRSNDLEVQHHKHYEYPSPPLRNGQAERCAAAVLGLRDRTSCAVAIPAAYTGTGSADYSRTPPRPWRIGVPAASAPQWLVPLLARSLLGNGEEASLLHVVTCDLDGMMHLLRTSQYWMVPRR